jgi:vacuolar-type H+-ATPase subunit E/Vma4
LNDFSKEQKIEAKPGEPLDHGTGVVIEATNGHLQYDNTLETRLQRTWNATRSQVFHLLMGETL